VNKKTLLLVEPDSDIAVSLHAVLEEFCTIVHVKNAEDAIAATGSKEFSLVIMEIGLMGPHSGLEFLHELKSYPDTADVPVIVFSMQQLASDDLAAIGVYKYYYKPRTTLAQVADAVKQALLP
jgi:CheY-like chemotaxis protein